jgi:hypothetical protein
MILYTAWRLSFLSTARYGNLALCMFAGVHVYLSCQGCGLRFTKQRVANINYSNVSHVYVSALHFCARWHYSRLCHSTDQPPTPPPHPPCTARTSLFIEFVHHLIYLSITAGQVHSCTSHIMNSWFMTHEHMPPSILAPTYTTIMSSTSAIKYFMNLQYSNFSMVWF